jgi:hypothetical protein
MGVLIFYFILGMLGVGTITFYSTVRCNWKGEGRGRCVVDLDLKWGRIVCCETNVITVHILAKKKTRVSYFYY